MKLFTFATHEEAEKTLEGYKTKKSDALYQINCDTYCLITGIGPFQAYTSLLPYKNKISKLYNFGIAASLSKELPLFSLHTIQSTKKLHWHPKKCTFSDLLIASEKGKRLVTVDFPLYDQETMENEADLVDMEGYAVHFFAKEHAIPCEIIKCVSDYANSDSKKTIVKNLPKLSETLYELVKMNTSVKQNFPMPQQ